MSENAPENAPEIADPAAPETAKVEEVVDFKAEAEKWKALSQKHEKAWRSRAGDLTPDQFREVTEKAKRLDEIEESQKSELQKAADKAAAAEAKAADLEARALRAEVSATKGVPAHLLSGSTQDELIESADALLAFRGEQPAPPPPDFGAGGRGTDVGTEKVAQLTNEDVKKLYAEKKYSEIEKARTEGRLANLLGA